MIKLFGYDDVVEMDNYAGYKINGYDGFNFTQPMKLQSFSDESAF